MADVILLETGDILLMEDGAGGFALESGRGQESILGQGSIAAVALTVALVGAAITASTGTVTPVNDTAGDVTAALTGQAVTVSQQSVASATLTFTPTGIALTGSLGAYVLSLRPTDPVGIASTVGQGSVSVVGNDVTVNISGVEADFAMGSVGTASPLVGSAVTCAAGTATPDYTRALTGEASTCAAGTIAPAQDADDTLITGSTGTPAAAFSVALIGSASTTATGTLTVTGDLTLALTGEESTAETGDVSPDPFFDVTGLEIVTAQQNIGAPGGATLTGSAITVTAGNVFTTTDREFALTGQSVSVSAGITFASSLAFPAGAELIFAAQSIGPRGADLTGLSISAEQGFVDPPRKDKGAGNPKKKRDHQKKKVLVEIDGQEFLVDSREEAEALLAQALEIAQERAKAEIAKASASKSSTKRAMRSVRHNLRPTQIEVSGDVDLEAQVADFRRKMAEINEDAVRSAEIALLLRRKQQDDEDEFVIGLLL